MSGFLDATAPSIEAEYGRYTDGDLLGKLITRNLLINRLEYGPEAVYIPVGRYGDATKMYAVPGTVAQDPGDGHVEIEGQQITFEVKCARLNIANRSAGQTAENWAFVNVQHSPGKAEKSYHVLIAIGVYALGLEDGRYWNHLLATHERLSKLGHASRVERCRTSPSTCLCARSSSFRGPSWRSTSFD
jgi:hypothetical protein